MINQKDNSLDEIVFEQRNKNYGAYELRNTQNKTLLNSLLIGAGTVVSLVIGLFFINKLYAKPITEKPTIITLTDVTVKDNTKKAAKKENEKDKIRENIKRDKIKPVNQNHSSEKVTADNIEKVNATMPVPKLNPAVQTPPEDQSKMNNAELSNINSAGVKGDNTSITKEKGNNAEKGTETSSPKGPQEVYYNDAVEEEATYKGGITALRQFINTNIDFPAGEESEGKVIVKFVVEKDGSISNFKVLKPMSKNFDNEVIRVLKMTSKKWKPAKVNGEPVRAYFNIPVIFKLPEN